MGTNVNLVIRMEGIKPIRSIGLMCGTSHDGLDLLDATFYQNGGKWRYQIHGSKFFPLPDSLRKQLGTIENASFNTAIKLDRDVAFFFADAVGLYLKEIDSVPAIIASHGITIFHQPKQCISLQIGSGAVIAAHTNIPVVSDFRAGDVALGGQGAPLVPKGEVELFNSFDACLNLGGFSNITLLNKNPVTAFDVSPCNIILNELSERMDMEYDAGGNIARSGAIIQPMLEELNQLPYYFHVAPKSLGKEWAMENIQPILKKFEEHPVPDLLQTFTIHIADQIAKVSKNVRHGLITGGGAYNTFLIEILSSKTGVDWTVPTQELVEFKEALIFAFLGVLRLLNLPNTLPSATGARRAISAGAIYLP